MLLPNLFLASTGICYAMGNAVSASYHDTNISVTFTDGSAVMFTDTDVAKVATFFTLSGAVAVPADNTTKNSGRKPDGIPVVLSP